LSLALAALTGCSGSRDISVQARFTDVGDLATRAPVMMADVKVGHVTGIRLSGSEALVTMSIEEKALVPRDVQARVRRTSLLGERIVDLVVPDGLSPEAPLLADGATIANTTVRPDLEDLVQAGNALLGPITASEVATLVDEGAKGFGGNGQALRGLLDNLGQITKAYAGRTGEIRSLITSLNQLNTTLASHASAQALSVRNSAQALGMLREESARLQDAIHALARLSVGARGIMDAHSAQMGRFFQQMRVILGVLQARQSDINNFLRYAPLHNQNTQLVDQQQFDQIYQDFVICGFNDNPSDPARRCKA
jgi:phospholipid/cholesterol/gamma-HCH transport system substrate-binding protein